MINIKEMTVLIADDMENMYNSIRNIMKLNGFGKRFMYASNGEDALKILKEKSDIDLAIIDNNMPVMTGLELLEIIRGEKQLRDMPIVMITAQAEKEFVTNAAESEIDAYLLKPITVKLLKDKIPPVIENANNPSPMVYHLKRAYGFAEEGDLGSAIEEAKLAKEANPKSSRPLREIGYYFFQKGDLGEAEEYLIGAAEKNPIDVVAFQYLGDVYLERGDIDRALKYLDKAIKISPRHIERGLNLGKILIRKNMINKAMPVLKKAFQLSKNPLELKEEIAFLCIEAGAREYASMLLVDIVKQKKNRGDLLFKLGVIFEEIGKNEESLYYLTEAEKLDEKNPEIKIHLAVIYIDMGMLIRAEKPLKAVLEIDPENKKAEELLRQCI